VSWPEHKVRKGEKAATVPAGYPAQRDLWQRIERARLLELEEGGSEKGPVVYREPNARTQRWLSAGGAVIDESTGGRGGSGGPAGAARRRQLNGGVRSGRSGFGESKKRQ
jgi:hypothetical protein